MTDSPNVKNSGDFSRSFEKQIHIFAILMAAAIIVLSSAVIAAGHLCDAVYSTNFFKLEAEPIPDIRIADGCSYSDDEFTIRIKSLEMTHNKVTAHIDLFSNSGYTGVFSTKSARFSGYFTDSVHSEASYFTDNYEEYYLLPEGSVSMHLEYTAENIYRSPDDICCIEIDCPNSDKRVVFICDDVQLSQDNI